jgi:hypothetical protein
MRGHGRHGDNVVVTGHCASATGAGRQEPRRFSSSGTPPGVAQTSRSTRLVLDATSRDPAYEDAPNECWLPRIGGGLSSAQERPRRWRLSHGGRTLPRRAPRARTIPHQSDRKQARPDTLLPPRSVGRGRHDASHGAASGGRGSDEFHLGAMPIPVAGGRMEPLRERIDARRRTDRRVARGIQ